MGSAHALNYVVVLSEEDPVAQAVSSGWGHLPRTDHEVDGTPIRRLSETAGVLRRKGLHIFDDAVRVDFPLGANGFPPTLVFPSVHRSASSRETLTVHPLGNPGESAEVGGRPGRLVPSDARLMAAALRRWAEVGTRIGWPTSFESTHHGPSLEQPAFFVEIGAADWARPPKEAVDGLRSLLAGLESDPRDRLALGLGGGHYAPHFTDLVLERRWAFGHLLPRHALEGDALPRIEEAWRCTPGCEGLIYHRAQDAEGRPWMDRWPRLRDTDAERRDAKA